MKYVLDSCAGFKTLLAEQDSDKAQHLCDDYRNTSTSYMRPMFFP